MPSNYIRGANNYDAAYVLADTQTVTADVEGKDSGGTAIQLDLADYVGTQWVAHLRYTAADFTTGDETYELQIESCAATNFTTITDEKVIPMGIAATVAAASNKYFQIGGFTVSNRYVRLYVNVAGTSPSLVIDKVWISPLG